ncbi:SusD/RagB family nutrient-binding outer membrane lipoprotein [Empedobacter brevis]|uniref:SusD/RagB family nutrient-binding outer membrane lipoprotein n=1 Tax=Empedobacter brevis TaxID=247 RepID=UPI0039AEC6F4
MKKLIFKISLVSLFTLGIAPILTSCVDEELNVDSKHPSTLPSENFLATGIYQFSYYSTTPSVNYNNYVFFVQNLSETTYFDESRYNLVTRNQPRNHYDRMYVYTLGNIRNAKKTLLKEGFTDAEVSSKFATLEIFEILTWENIVNTFGNVPYSEALQGDDENPNYTAKYDDAKTIYIDLIKRIDTVIASIDTTVKGYASGDVIYQGDMIKWIQTANAIKLRLGLNLADTDPALAKSTIESAVSSGVYSDSSNNFTFKYDSGIFTNPFFDNFVASGRDDFIASNTIIDLMNNKEDPRRDVWFTKVDGEYIGGIFGQKNPFARYSHLSEEFFLAKNVPSAIISYTEIAFMLAEAAQRGYNVGGSASDYYNKAITSSFLESGIADKADAYIAKHPYDASNWKKSIGVQAYIALYTKAYATWNFTRRLDYPILNNPSNSLTETIPFRMPYSDQEYLLNKTNVEAAATAIGGDNVSTKLFWDKY